MGVTTWARTMHRLFALFAFAAIAVAHSAPEDSAVAENFVQSAPEFVESQDDDYNMSAENLLAELNGKSWKSLEAEFNQLIQNEDSDTQMAKMDPEELGQLTMDAMHKDQSAELEQMYAAPKAKSEESDIVATDAKMESRTGWHRWRPHAHIPHRWRPVRQITRAVRHVGRWAARAARAVGGVIVSAVKRLGAYLKRLAAKLCRKVLYQTVYQSCRQGLPPGRWFPCCRCCGCRHRRRLQDRVQARLQSAGQIHPPQVPVWCQDGRLRRRLRLRFSRAQE